MLGTATFWSYPQGGAFVIHTVIKSDFINSVRQHTVLEEQMVTITKLCYCLQFNQLLKG